MHKINIDNLTLEEVKSRAHDDARLFCTESKISELTEVNTSCNLAYINYNTNIDFIEFTINNNPFGIYDKLSVDKDPNKMMSTDYSFPINTVSNNVVVYFDEYVDYINKNYDFTKIKGNIEYRDKQKKTGTYKNIRKFFTLPEESKLKDPPLLGHLRIEPKKWVNKVPSKSYELMIKRLDEDINENVSSFKELLSCFPKRSSYKVFVKATKLHTCYKNYGEEYKMCWQIFGAKQVNVAIDSQKILKNLLLEDEQSDNPQNGILDRDIQIIDQNETTEQINPDFNIDEDL